MWRKQALHEEIVAIEPGVCLTIPLGTHFQFRAFGSEPLAVLGVTMPPGPARARPCLYKAHGNRLWLTSREGEIRSLPNVQLHMPAPRNPIVRSQSAPNRVTSRAIRPVGS
jgi:hypothetical protein